MNDEENIKFWHHIDNAVAQRDIAELASIITYYTTRALTDGKKLPTIT